MGIAGGAAYCPDVLQPETIDTDFDRLNHRTLDVFGKHETIRSDAVGQTNGEPAASRAEVRDDAGLANSQHVHDLARLLPFIAIGNFKLTEVLSSEQPRVLCEGCRDSEHERQREHRERRAVEMPHDFLTLLVRDGDDRGRGDAGFLPGTPGDVIASGERMPSSSRSGNSLRSRTSSRIGRPVLTDAFAMSAVAA